MNDTNSARNVLGSYQMWAQNFPFLNTAMYFLQWLVIPVEVFLKRDFGQRWFTTVNFYVGFLVLFWFNVTQQAGSMFGSFLGGSRSRQPTRSPFGFYEEGAEAAPAEPSLWDKFLENSMLWFLLAYLLLSAYHFFKIWWRNRTNTPLHSFDDGKSRLEPFAGGAMTLINAIATPVIGLFIRLLPERDRAAGRGTMPPLLNDESVFANTVLEPLLLFILGLLLSGTASTWLLVSAFALGIFASWNESKKLDRLLDVRDNIIEGADMREAMKGGDTPQRMNSAQKEIVQQIAQKVETAPEVAAQVKADFPDLDDIISQMHSKPKG
jgi:hypothetical protein